MPDLREFDPDTAAPGELAAWNRYGNRIAAEAWPDDPPTPLEAEIRELRSRRAHERVKRWGLWTGDGEVVARARVDVWDVGTNEHAADFAMSVHPEWRRRGLATRLLREIAAQAREWERRLLFCTTTSRVPSGDEFLRRIGARPGLVEHTNQLDLDGLDRELIERWRGRGTKLEGEFAPEFFTGPYPEDRLEELARMKEAQNLMPRGSLEIEDEKYTPELLRENDRVMVERGDERWTLLARDLASGEIAGYTEVWWRPHTPETLYQDDTAVFPRFQNRGIGRWLKAEMLHRVLEGRPGVRRVRTWNADSNAPMLKINTELGFRVYQAHTGWQVERDAVEAYLGSRE